MEIFRRCGYHETSFSKLVDELGVGRQSLYNTYGDKHALFLKALDRYIDVQTEQRQACFFGDGEPIERLHTLLDRVAEQAADPEDRGCLVVHTAMELAAEDAEVAARVQRSLDGLEGDLHKLIREGIRRGQLADRVKPDALASLFIAQICSITVLRRAGYGPTAIRKQIKALKDLLEPRKEKPEISRKS